MNKNSLKETYNISKIDLYIVRNNYLKDVNRILHKLYSPFMIMLIIKCVNKR